MTFPGPPDGAPATTSESAAVDHTLGGVAHEIRNALFAVVMTLEALEISEPNAAELSGFVAALRRQLEPLHALAADLALLDDPPAADFAPASFATLLRAASERCASERPEAPRVVIAGAHMTEARVHVEHASVLRALTHLFSYVLARSADGFEVRPVVRDVIDAGEPHLECIIEDNGPTLNAGDLPHLFDAFLPRSRGGFDLRLATVRRVIERHGGTIHAEGAPAGGIRIVFRLPTTGAVHTPAQATPR